MDSRRGLGFGPGAAAVIVKIAPAAGPAAPLVIAGAVVAALLPFALKAIGNIRAGADEADEIVPVQNRIGEILAAVDPLILTSDVPRLQHILTELQEMARYFIGFLRSNFTDGRAPAQAANTIMPQLDGTGGYAWPAMQGYPVEKDKWGNVVAGGRIGHIQRRITELGGYVGPPQLTAGGYLPTLATITEGDPFIPQAGLSLTAGGGQAAALARAPSASTPYMVAAAAAALTLLVFSGRRF